MALPQYKTAVWKSKNTQLKTLITAIWQAENIYHLANGTYSINFEDLSLDFPLTLKTTSACGLAIPGNKSVYQGKDFEVVLNGWDATGIAATGVWTQGPYKCSGFQLSSSGLYCLGLEHAEPFCKNLEHATISTINGGSYKVYQMP